LLVEKATLALAATLKEGVKALVMVLSLVDWLWTDCPHRILREYSIGTEP
jgi:hypothetical protein